MLLDDMEMLESNESFSNRIELVEYKDALAITGAIQGPYQEKLY